MPKLSEKRCIPCEGGMPAFGKKEIGRYISKIDKGWTVNDGKKLRREFKFKNFAGTMGFVNEVAIVAAAEDHHPDMRVSYGKVVIELWTHSVGGLSENDFILAAKIDELI